MVKRLLEEYKIKYCTMFIVGILLYLPTITGRLGNPDAISIGYTVKRDYGWENALGRYGLKVLAALKGYNINPYISSVIAIGLLCISIVFVIDLFEVKKNYQMYIIAVVMLSSIHIANGMTYYYCFDMYMFSMLLCTFAIWYATKVSNISSYIIPPIAIMLSYTIYQAYISVAIVLCMMVMILKLMTEDVIKNLAILGVKYLCAGGVGTVGYLVLTKVYVAMTGMALAESRGFGTMGKISLGNIPRLIANAYREFANYYFGDGLVANWWAHKNLIHLIVVVVIVCSVIGYFVIDVFKNKKLDYRRLLLEMVMLLLLPVGFMVEEIIFPEVSIYESTGMLVLTSMNLLFVLALLVVDKVKIENKYVKLSINTLAGILICFMGWIGIVYVGIFQEYMANNIKVGTLMAQEVSEELDKIENIQDYGVAIYGDPVWGMDEYEYILKGTVAPYHIVWKSNIYGSGLVSFFYNYCNKNYRFVDWDRCNMINQNKSNMEIVYKSNSMNIYKDNEYVLVSLW